MMMHLCEMGKNLVAEFSDFSELRPEDLFLLAANSILAIRIKNFVDTKSSQDAVAAFLKKAEGIQGSCKRVIGQPFSETKGDAEAKRSYFEKASEVSKDLHDAFPLRCPLDSLISLMRQKVKARGGAQVMKSRDGKEFSPGLVQVLNGDVLGHQKMLERELDIGDLPSDCAGASQIDAYLYVDVPLVGGELILWKRSLDADEYDRLRGGSDGISLPVLGLPKVVLKPKRGELILFNAGSLHATRGLPPTIHTEASESDIDSICDALSEKSKDEEMETLEESSNTPERERDNDSRDVSPTDEKTFKRRPPELGNCVTVSTSILFRQAANKLLLFYS
uniref:Prolyl 4-hydroxylase alpha subunit Fe(2+) 2OG dioxygenase domain-containing protein n=1 Tax=Chromera velia CCMP2878 TaxID=1169474 RepID=A0A0G4HQI1_9ALVE|eukprot:Cvel_30182.t1-p1 / transcript=Cvel_30182.t1 / gene=Cvel_30182 / organism=Chromera_velia_CCMP2878 / gene_product=hypothetical protein / transcript_product=hypothetical protein / location=Cvel_scaffold4266:7886-9317(+) / protein_length=334 / sequence_SO=supercontig / SO=protein_coding / is_pseudo=false